MKKGSKRHSGTERLNNIFEDIVSSAEFLLFAKQMERDFQIISAQCNKYNPETDDLREYMNKFDSWENRIKDFCIQKDLAPSDFCPLLSIVIRHGKEDWLQVIDQEMIKVKENKHSKDCFPIKLEISAYASRNNILEFIERNYTTLIKPLQEKHAKNIGLGKVRRKRTRERDDYVYELSHDGKKSKEIADLVNKKFPNSIIGYDDINKILRKRIKPIK